MQHELTPAIAKSFSTRTTSAHAARDVNVTLTVKTDCKMQLALCRCLESCDKEGKGARN